MDDRVKSSSSYSKTRDVFLESFLIYALNLKHIFHNLEQEKEF